MAAPKSIGRLCCMYQLVETELKWTISNLDCMGCKGNGDFVRSPTFVTKCGINYGKDAEWYLQLYPKGNTERGITNGDYMSLYLYCKELYSDIEADVTFKILNNKGESAAIGYHRFQHTFKLPHEASGHDDFVLQSFVFDPANGILDKDELTISCKIEIKINDESLIDSPNEIEEQEVEENDSLFHENFHEALLNDDTFSDVVLMTEGKTITAHKCILANSSSVFARMFKSEMKEKLENCVKIIDIKHDVLKEMLRFIYAGKVNNIDALVGELAIAADKYALEALKTKCEKTMMKNLSVDNAIEYLQLADSIRMNELKNNVIDFMVENATDFTGKTEFYLLPNDLLAPILQTLEIKK